MDGIAPKEKGILFVEDGDALDFYYNPNTIPESHSARYTTQQSLGRSHPHYHYVGGGEKELSFSIMLKHEVFTGIKKNPDANTAWFGALTKPFGDFTSQATFGLYRFRGSEYKAKETAQYNSVNVHDEIEKYFDLLLPVHRDGMLIAGPPLLTFAFGGIVRNVYLKSVSVTRDYFDEYLNTLLAHVEMKAVEVVEESVNRSNYKG